MSLIFRLDKIWSRATYRASSLRCLQQFFTDKR